MLSSGQQPDTSYILENKPEEIRLIQVSSLKENVSSTEKNFHKKKRWDSNKNQVEIRYGIHKFDHIDTFENRYDFLFGRVSERVNWYNSKYPKFLSCSNCERMVQI